MAATALVFSPLLRLLLLLLLGYAVSIPVQYQTLVVSPLRKPATLPHDDPLLSSGTLAAAETSLHLRLAHRDSFLAATNSTAEEILRLRLARDAARVSRLHSSLAASASGSNPNATAPRSRGGFRSSVVSGLAKGSGEYFTRIGVGTPATAAYMVLDTGSDLVWLQCAPCRRCYPQADPIFDPRRSRSYVAVPCAAPLCRRLDPTGCDLRRRSCLYVVSYGDGSVTTGDFSTETLTFADGVRVGRVALGCGHDNEGLFVAAAGLLGLGRGSLSFPSQVARRFGRRFSYCLVDRTSSGASSPGRASSVVFGESAVPPSAAFTPMVRNPRMETFYYVAMTGISVGGARVPGVAESDLRLDPATGKGGVIVDSGTSVTRLATAAYAAVRDAFRAGAAGLKQAPEGFSLFDTCYDLSGKTEVKVPTVTMHLAGGAEVELPGENYLIPVNTKGTFCFALASTESGVSIIGNIQQQGFRIVFDGDGERVGFVPKGC